MKISKRLLLPLLILLLLTLAACNAADEAGTQPELPANFTRFDKPEIGFSFGYPQDWAMREGPRGFAVVSQESYLENPSITVENRGAIVTIGLGKVDQIESENPIDIANKLLEASGAAGNMEMLQAPTSTSVNGQQAAVATFRSQTPEGLSLTQKLYVIRKDDRVVTVTTSVPTENEAQYGLVTESIVNSILITPIAAAPAGG